MWTKTEHSEFDLYHFGFNLIRINVIVEKNEIDIKRMLIGL
jgi:hypothetical protein